MKSEPEIGSKCVLEYVVPENKVVRFLYPEAPEFQQITDVFATGFMVGLMEWACTKFLNRHLDSDEISVGVFIETTHSAATPPGAAVTVEAELVAIDGRQITWSVVARDPIDEIGRGTHKRAVVDRVRFEDALNFKRSTIRAGT